MSTPESTRDCQVIEVEPMPKARRDSVPQVKFVKGCPFCGKRHIHGAQPDGGDPGHLVAHCLDGIGTGRGYYLVVRKES